MFVCYDREFLGTLPTDGGCLGGLWVVVSHCPVPSLAGGLHGISASWATLTYERGYRATGI